MRHVYMCAMPCQAPKHIQLYFCADLLRVCFRHKDNFQEIVKTSFNAPYPGLQTYFICVTEIYCFSQLRQCSHPNQEGGPAHRLESPTKIPAYETFDSRLYYSSNVHIFSNRLFAGQPTHEMRKMQICLVLNRAGYGQELPCGLPSLRFCFNGSTPTSDRRWRLRTFRRMAGCTISWNRFCTCATRRPRLFCHG